MFLTKYQLNPVRRGTVRLLASPQRMHAAVLAAFPPSGTTEAGPRVLWRVDEPSPHELNLFVVSPERPSLEHLDEQAGWSNHPGGKTRDYRPFLERLEAGQRWVFRLAGNPVRSLSAGPGKRGKVVPHITADQQRSWLVERAERHGFFVGGSEEPSVQVTRRDRNMFSKSDGPGRGRRQATITRAQFDGILTIQDPELLRRALTLGIGRAKAYGCGLLTLAPPP